MDAAKCSDHFHVNRPPCIPHIFEQKLLSRGFIVREVAQGGASLADEERGAAKPRGRGLGQRNKKTCTSKKKNDNGVVF